VTRGAQAVGEAEGVAVAQAPLWGLGRTLALEHPELGCTQVDLSPGPALEEAQALARELVGKDGEDQVALRSEGPVCGAARRGAFGPKTRRAGDCERTART
jgi:hypothetical protein